MGASGYISENDFFRRPASQEGGDLVEEFGLLHEETIPRRNLHGITEGGNAARYYGNLLDWIRTR